MSDWLFRYLDNLLILIAGTILIILSVGLYVSVIYCLALLMHNYPIVAIIIAVLVAPLFLM